MRKKLLVTGGCGFIGSCFIRYILKNYPESEIVNVDALTYAGNVKNIPSELIKDRYSLVHSDIADQERMKRVFDENDFDYVVNFAAESHVDRSITDPGNFVHSNYVGVGVLLELARKNKVKKWVQISTDEVYGSLEDSGLFTEQTPLAPSSPYSSSKAAADLLVLSYRTTYGLPVCITRCSNNYGPYQHPEKLIPTMIIKALKNESLPVYGTGKNVRDWIYVQDHVRGIISVMENGISGEVYNFGASEEMKNIELVENILDYLEKPKSLITYVEDRLGHDKRYAIDSSKAKSCLSWEPEKNFDTALKETIDWYLKNEEWWKPKGSGKRLGIL